LGAFCTVFSATEVLEKIRSGKEVAGIVKGIYLSMVRRVMEMDFLENKVVLTGGVVAHNPILAEMLAQEAGRPVAVPEHPQLTGALGAALLARDQNQDQRREA
ncbi:MAG: ATPase, partial [Deltaproteobacteria bacterium]|nr:ATPase [Deltaproteobacteria bacterium]